MLVGLENQFLVFFFSGRLRQVLLYVCTLWEELFKYTRIYYDLDIIYTFDIVTKFNIDKVHVFWGHLCFTNTSLSMF